MVDDPADYRWSSYRSNALGQSQPIVTPHSIYLALASNAKERQATYRALFRAHLDQAALDDIRLSLNQSQPLGDCRFPDTMTRMLGERWQPKPRGRPPAPAGRNDDSSDQTELPL